MSVTPFLLNMDVEFAISSPRVSVAFMWFVLSLKSEVNCISSGEADVVPAAVGLDKPADFTVVKSEVPTEFCAVDEFAINVGIIAGDCEPTDV